MSINTQSIIVIPHNISRVRVVIPPPGPSRFAEVHLSRVTALSPGLKSCSTADDSQGLSSSFSVKVRLQYYYKGGEYGLKKVTFGGEGVTIGRTFELSFALTF
jgi:hypothetical protein